MGKWLMFLPPALFLGLAVVFYVGMQRQNPEDIPSVFLDKQAPSISAGELAGFAGVTDADLRRGDVVLVNFWASWCPPCRAEHPLIESLAEEGITVLGVNYRDDPARALDFLSELGNPYAAIGADPRARLGLDWGVVGLPETFVVNGRGEILYRHAGPVTDEVIADRIRPALERAANGS